MLPLKKKCLRCFTNSTINHEFSLVEREQVNLILGTDFDVSECVIKTRKD